MKTLLLGICLLLTSISLGQKCVPPPQTSVAAYPSGTIIPDVGSTDMPISTKNPKSKALTQQGFALIHCFWPNEAIRSFRDSTKEDPTSAIAWCGLNIALTQPWFAQASFAAEAEYAIKQAIANIDTASSAEQDLIRAFRLRSLRRDDRGSEFEKAMQEVLVKHPKLDEPSLLWVGIRTQLCMNVGYLPNGDPRQDLEFVVKLVEPIIKRSPKNAGAMHYWIHACEPYSPKRAEKAADDIRVIAKGSPHMVHMAGHIYNRVGRYLDAHQAFSRAKEMDEALAQKLNVPPSQAIWQYHHNVTFLTMNILELGRIDEAIAMSRIAGQTRMDIASRVGDWANAFDSRRTDPMALAMKNAYLARADIEQKNLPAAIEKLSEAKKGIEKTESPRWGATYSRLVKTVVLESEGLVLAAQGKIAEAEACLRESIKAFKSIEYDEPVLLIQIPHESLGNVLTQAGQFDKAIAAYREGLIERPNSGWLLFGVAKAHEAAGRKADAEKNYNVFLNAWKTADRDRPEIKHAEQFMASLASKRS